MNETQWEGGCGTYRQAKRKTSKEDAAMVASEKER